MAMSIFEVLDRDFQDQVESTTEALISGKAKDYAEYREMCGRIRGLRYAQQANNDLAKRYRDGDDDD